MRALKTNINGSTHIGLYGVANNSFCLLGKTVSKDKVKQIKRVLDVPVYQLNDFGIPLIGVFFVLNQKTLLVPNNLFDDELKQLDKFGIDYKKIDTKHTALGNNILLSEKAGLINPSISDSVKKSVEKAAKVLVEKDTIAGIPTVGSCACLSDKGGLVHAMISQDQLKRLEKLFKLSLHPATINMGNPFISTGILKNSNGYVIGELTTGYEVLLIEEYLFGK